jgi:hypothetical protein
MTKNIDKIVFNVTAQECLWPCRSQKKAKKTLKKSTRIKKEKHRTTDNRGKASEDQVDFQKPSHLQDSKQNHSEDKQNAEKGNFSLVSNPLNPLWQNH